MSTPITCTCSDCENNGCFYNWDETTFLQMVCRRSLYCWKNGPCASDQARKQIWEDNIRFRESLRDINQSDHYWSFQISKNNCICLEGEDVWYSRPLSRKYRSASLQRLHQTDCTSVTHDCNGLKFRNCYVHCPIYDHKNEGQRADTPIPQPLVKKIDSLSCPKYLSGPANREEKTEFCKRYKNTLSDSALKPVMKTKFLSQSNLNSIQNTKSLKKKSFHSSCETLKVKPSSSVKETKQQESVIENKNIENEIHIKEDPKIKELNPVVKVPPRKPLHEYAPISRTTRKMLSEVKQTPFVTNGCNNKNQDIGSKRTHNVLASKLEVYPNALSAKQQKKNLILKYIQSEKEFQRKCIPEELRKRFVNHSSLWSLDNSGKENKVVQKKSTKYLPAMTKPPPRIKPNQLDSSYYKTYRKPQIYFY